MATGINQELSFIPAWRGDESLYSWASSFHKICGNGSHRDTGTLLFGAAHACKERNAPTGLHHFVQVTGGSLGDVLQLLRTRCSIGLFIPFLTSARRAIFLDRTNSVDGPGWTTTLGMSASGLSQNSHLRYCESCLNEDIANQLLPKWRWPHQLVGSWVCSDHSQPLKTVIQKSFTWILPDVSIGEYQHAEPTPTQLEVLRKMSLLAQFAAHQEHLDLNALRQSALNELRRQGISSWSHPLSKDRLAGWFAASSLAQWLRTVRSPESSLATGSWIHDLLRGRRGDHPLKWLLLWSVLFAHDASSQRRFSTPWSEPQWDIFGQSSLWVEECIGLPSDINQIILDAKTLADAAKQLGLTTGALRDRLIKLGEFGGSFRREQGIPLRRQRAMNSILKYIAHRPDCTLGDVHRECKAAVSWLRANCPEDFAIATQELRVRSSRQMLLL